jgi:hypothetical protein
MTEVVRGSSAEGQPSDIYGDEVAGWSCNVSVTSFLTRRGIQSVRQRSKESQRAFFLTFGTNAGEYLASNAEAQATSFALPAASTWDRRTTSRPVSWNWTLWPWSGLILGGGFPGPPLFIRLYGTSAPQPATAIEKSFFAGPISC